MTHEEFGKLFEARVKKSRETLVTKAQEYATDNDRMHNFRVAAALRGTTIEDALWGMAAKHIVSVSDMVRKTTIPGDQTICSNLPDLEQWDEKLGDALNYMFLLDAVIQQLYSLPPKGIMYDSSSIKSDKSDFPKEFYDSEDTYPKGMVGFLGGK